jgi:RimJ/RimL family protein N-acetyltransferase
MIETDRLIIRYANVKDLDDMYVYVGDEHVMKYERESYPTKESYLKVLEAVEKYHVLYAICIKGNPKVIGHIYL